MTHKTKHTILLFLIFHSYWNFAFSQQPSSKITPETFLSISKSLLLENQDSLELDNILQQIPLAINFLNEKCNEDLESQFLGNLNYFYTKNQLYTSGINHMTEWAFLTNCSEKSKFLKFQLIGSCKQAKGEFNNALFFFNKALDIAIASKLYFEEVAIYTSLVQIYDLIGKKENFDSVPKQLEYSKKSLEICKAQGFDYKLIQVNMILLSNLEEATELFKSVTTSLSEEKDPFINAAAHLNYGKALLKFEKQQEALNILLMGKEILKKVPSSSIYFEDLKYFYDVVLGATYVKLNNESKAKFHLNQAVEYNQNHPNQFSKLSVLEELIQLYKELGDTNKVAELYKRYLNTSKKIKYGSVFFEKELKKINLELSEIEAANKNQRETIFKERIIFFFFGLILLFVISYLLLKRKHIKEIDSKNKEISNSLEVIKQQNKALKTKNLEANSQLKGKLLILTQANQTIQILEDEINKSEMDYDIKKRLLERIRDYDDEERWEDIEKQFVLINANFIKKLRSIQPNISSKDIRLSLWIKLGLSNKEIAKLMFSTPSAMKVTRNRLRKKLGITDPSVKLLTFLNSIDEIP